MKQKMMIKQAKMENKNLHLITDPNIDLSALKPAGQMLVDSDQLSFVFLVELEGDYSYIFIPEETWSVLPEALETNADVFVVNEKSRLNLTGFQEELSYLIENIKGNSNYGEEMVGKVESTF